MMPLWFSTAMVSHINAIVVELTAWPDRFGGASLGAVMKGCDSQLLLYIYTMESFIHNNYNSHLVVFMYYYPWCQLLYAMVISADSMVLPNLYIN